MKFLCIGGDRRQIETALYLKKKGYEVSIFGLPKNEDLKSVEDLYNEIRHSDAVILPLPVSRDSNTVSTPLTGDVIFLQDILVAHPKKVFGGIIKPDLITAFKNNNIEFYDYYNSEALTVKNAVLTAEAALAIAINCTDSSIYGSRSLVLGYGRIGRQLARYLKALGSSVSATSRKDGTLASIEADGIIALKTEDAPPVCGDFDLIFNTIPSPILNKEFFKNCKKSAFVEDLATDAGTDLASAREFGINAAVYGGLPGKHSPVTAAQFITEEILNNIS